MLEFQLFRIKVYPPKQMVLFQDEKKPSEILKETILSAPSMELRKKAIWRIGNIHDIDNNGLYFRIGRSISSRVELYKDGNFIEQEFETAPYTHVLLDFSLEVCAIAKKTRICATTKGIATQFIRLLNKSEKAVELRARFEIDEISDPEDFIAHLRKAYAVSKFWVTFSRSNAFDVNEDFIRPMQNLLKETQAEKGKSEIKGDSLNVDHLEELTRSAAATGDNASAEIRLDEKGNRIRRHLRGKSVIVSIDGLDEGENTKMNLLNKIRTLYRRIRGKES